jgi:ATP-dependent helicase HrpB
MACPRFRVAPGLIELSRHPLKPYLKPVMADRLPIYELEDALVAQCRAHRRLVLQAPTGSGKSTQVPQMLLAHGFLDSGQVVILQPRRLATRLLAARVARERGTELGREVGYQIRFDHVAEPETRIKYVTEGILLRQMVQDPLLSGVDVLVFDEFHERHLYGDITLARALDLQAARRPDLLILVMSATLETKTLEKYLHPCSVLRSEGRMFPVEIQYLPRRPGPGAPPVWDLAAGAFEHYVRNGGRGDVLVFMPGSFEINQTLEAIRHSHESAGYLLLPLHGELSPRDQDAAVARYDRPKVVVSTNVAETSVTIEGVRLVIDSGLARLPRYEPHRGINTLLIERISQASADQRAGRAGRTAPGTCARLWSLDEHWERPAHELPEIKRLDLAEVVLTLKAAGVDDLRRFRWLEPPSEQALAHAEELLVDLGALHVAEPPPTLSSIGVKPKASAPSSIPDSAPAPLPCPAVAQPGAAPPLPPASAPPLAHITPVGRKMLAFPIHPRYSRMLLAAGQYGCVYQACLVAALTQGRDLLLRRPGREVAAFREDLFGDRAMSDFWVLMRAWNYASKNNCSIEACRRAGIHAVTARQIGRLLDQFLRIAKDEGLDVEPRRVPDEALQKCILIGFSDRVARRLDTGTLRCELVHGRRGVLARESAVQDSPLFVAAEVSEIGGSDQTVKTLLSLATAIEADWLRDLFPEDIRSEMKVEYDATARRVVAQDQLRFRDLPLEIRRLEPPPAEPAARLLAAEVAAGRLTLPNWDHHVDQWLLRLNLLSRWCPELQLPPVTEDDRSHLIEQLCLGAISFKDLKDRRVRPVIEAWLSSAQKALLDKHAPERLTLSNARTPKVTYVTDGPPFVALRIQELFGVKATPRIAMNRVPVVVHILAPSMRPVQITQDLAGFWRDHYPRIKQELQRKYPKHEWK